MTRQRTVASLCAEDIGATIKIDLHGQVHEGVLTFVAHTGPRGAGLMADRTRIDLITADGAEDWTITSWDTPCTVTPAETPTPRTDASEPVLVQATVLREALARWFAEEKFSAPHDSPWRVSWEDLPKSIKALCRAKADALLAGPLAEHDRLVTAKALDDAADALEWVRPDRSPCAHPEDCCGSEASCDAMQPLTHMVGQGWLRNRAQVVRAEE